jgi:hypothetical protein
MSSAAETRPFQPSWVTTWEDLAPFLDQSPEIWCEGLGVPKQEPSRWLMVLRYTVGEAGTLVRPTFLDAGWAAFHFPSPPQAVLITGGHPMDLRPIDSASPAERLSREFIHSEIQHRIEHWIDAGRRVMRTSRPTSVSLLDRRRHHHGRLVDTYGGVVGEWMPRP